MTEYPADENELIFPSYRSQKARDRYQQNFKHLLELAPGLKHLIGSSDSKKTAELKKIVGKVSICAYMHVFMLSDVDPRWSLLYQEHALMIRRV
jgi:hypothetical protein